MKQVIIYPGSFDPITNGHIDLIERALGVFDEIIVAIAKNPAKEQLFTMRERAKLIKDIFKDNPRVRVDSFEGLLVDYLRKNNIFVLLRGLRAVLDFEYEFQMALMNRKLERKVETIFMMTGYKWFYVSSRIIKEVVSSGGAVNGLVPDIISKKLKEKCGGKNSSRQRNRKK